MKKSLTILLTALLMFSCGNPEATDDAQWKSWAETPPMGWNSYDSYHGAITEDQFKACVDMLADELLPFGWEYAVIDFCWYTPADDEWYNQPWKPFSLAQKRDSAGNYIPNLIMDEYGRVMPDPRRWPSAADGAGFRAVGDYVHSKGMKFGIHIMRGIPREAVEKRLPVMGTNVTADQIAELSNTCPWMNHMYGVDIRKPGAQEYYNSVCKMYAEWGVDFIKADDMMVPPFHKGEIEMMHRAILNSGRPMVLSLSCGEAPLSGAYHIENNANMYRISADFWDRWRDMLRMFELAEMWSPFIGDGTWPDADMIPIGILHLGKNPNTQNNTTKGIPGRESSLTEAEHLALMSLWCIIRSPLMWGGDPLTSSEWSKTFLKNREVLEVNQNSVNNRQVFERNEFRVWIADIPGTDQKYVGLFNLADTERQLTFDFYWDLLNGPFIVRDLWKQEEIGVYEKDLTVTLRPHEGRLYRLTPGR
jgi:alpha-galactosidase